MEQDGDEHRAVGADELEAYRRELTVLCWRRLGHLAEAEDAVQETMLRAWRGLDRFEGKAKLRTWLYQIAINVCIDMRRQRSRTDASSRPEPLASTAGREQATTTECDPADIAIATDQVRLALAVAFAHLPERQRAVLILCEVFRWSAKETAELLGTTVAAVNSSLERARASLTGLKALPCARSSARDWGSVREYVDAFRAYDVKRLIQVSARCQ